MGTGDKILRHKLLFPEPALRLFLCLRVRLVSFVILLNSKVHFMSHLLSSFFLSPKEALL